jgi:hypothetical protein
MSVRKRLIITLDWALPDQLVFSTVSAMLCITSTHTEYSEAAATAVFKFIAEIVENITIASCEYINYETTALNLIP